MKYNYQENLNVKVPNDIRLSVYKKALSIIKKGESKFGLSQFYLCLLLLFYLCFIIWFYAIIVATS